MSKDRLRQALIAHEIKYVKGTPLYKEWRNPDYVVSHAMGTLWLLANGGEGIDPQKRISSHLGYKQKEIPSMELDFMELRSEMMQSSGLNSEQKRSLEKLTDPELAKRIFDINDGPYTDDVKQFLKALLARR